jgi:hypothetical protein
MVPPTMGAASMDGGRHQRVAIAGLLIATLAFAGCVAMQEDPAHCKVLAGLAGGVLGATAGAVGVDQIDPSNDNLTIAGGGAAGFLIGGAAGYGIGHLACPPAPEPEPQPEPPPSAPTEPQPPAMPER